MRLLHTADWHLGDRLGRIDRTDDLRRAVERVAAYCREYAVDVLLVAGDLFSELTRPADLRDAVRHLQDTFGDFLRTGGTILTLTGNHDNENFCQTLHHAMHLAAPASQQHGEVAASGRLYLATEPTLLRLAERDGSGQVQFLLMPYPTPARYLAREAAPRYQSHEERNRHLQAAFTRRLLELHQSERYRKDVPTVLSAHVAVRGSELALFRITEEEDVVFDPAHLPDDFAYVALGHIHKPQALGGHRHVRYCGSIERLDLGEQGDDKGVVLVDLGPGGLAGEPRPLPLEGTPVYRVELCSPLAEELKRLRERHPDAGRDLVRIEFTYTAGVDNVEQVLNELEDIFPRWYYRDWKESNALDRPYSDENSPTKSFEETVRDYLKQELVNHADEDRDAVLGRAESLMSEVRA
jgi:exonuclease SbcD